MSERSKPTNPPPPNEVTRRELLQRADDLRASAQRILTTAGDLVLIAERLAPEGAMRP